MPSSPLEMFSTKSHRKIPLRLILIIPFVLQVFLAVSLVGYLSFRDGRKAVNDLAYQLIDKAGQQVGDHLDTYMALPQQLNQLNVEAIAAGQLDLNNRLAGEQYFWRQAKVFDTINYIGYVLPNGDQVGAGRYLNGKDLVLFENLPGEGKASDYIAGSMGNRAGQIQTYDYDPIPDYQAVFEAGQPSWSDIFIAEINNAESTEVGEALQSQDPQADIGINYYVTVAAAYPFYDNNQQLLGVFNVDVLLTGISKFLQTLDVSPSGQVFIMDRDGLMVGSSGKHPILYRNGDVTERYQAIDDTDPLVRSVASTLKEQVGSFEAIARTQNFEVMLDGQRQFARVIPWRDQYGLDWLVVVTVPESDFMAQINANTLKTIGLCIGALILTMVLGVYTSRWIAQPILRLRYASEAIAAGQLDQQVADTGINELDGVGQSFNHMAKQLQDSFNELEKTNAELESRVEARTAELTQAVIDLRQTQTQLIQTEKMSSLGQLVAGVAHEINNPVNFIHGNLVHTEEYANHLLSLVELYRQEYPNQTRTIQAYEEDIELDFLRDDFPRLVKSMQVGAERIREIIKSLRNFSRLDEAECKTVDIHEGIDSTLMILQNRLKQTVDHPGIEVVKNYQSLPLVSCYPGQLNQVFMNLLTNAIDAIEEHHQKLTPEEIAANPGRIQISTEVCGPNQVLVRIADNGPGMNESILSKLFDPFFTTKPVGRGTGLGLSISYQIVVEKHGGAMYCYSAPGQGAEFVIELPIHTAKLAMAER